MQLQFDVAEQQAVVLSAPEGVDLSEKTLRSLAKLRLELDKECAKIHGHTECKKSGCHWSKQAARCTGSDKWVAPSLDTAERMYCRLNMLTQLPVSQLKPQEKLQIYYHDEYVKDLKNSVDLLQKMLKRNMPRDELLPFVTEILRSYPVVLLVQLNKTVAKAISPVLKTIVYQFLKLLAKSTLFGLDLLREGLWKVAKAAVKSLGRVATAGFEILENPLTKPGGLQNPTQPAIADQPQKGEETDSSRAKRKDCQWMKQLTKQKNGEDLLKQLDNCQIRNKESWNALSLALHPEKRIGDDPECVMMAQRLWQTKVLNKQCNTF